MLGSKQKCVFTTWWAGSDWTLAAGSSNKVVFGLCTLQSKYELNIGTYFYKYYFNKEELLYLLTVAKLHN